MIQLQTPTIPTDIPDSIPSIREFIGSHGTMSADELISKAVSSLTTFAVNLTIAILVFYTGKLIIKKLYTLAAGIMIRRKVDVSLTTFVLSLIKIALYFILTVTVIGILGIETSSFIAIFASAGVAIGMALSGTLQNFAGGVLILLIKPYKVGDYIEAQNYAGTVKEIQIFHTIITTYDNKCIIIPNGGLSTGSINNWSREDYRRVDWSVSISYGDDVDVAREKILEMLSSDSRVVKRYVEDDREQRDILQHEKELIEEPDSNKVQPKRRPWPYRIFRNHDKVREKIEGWKERQEAKTMGMIPKVDRSPVVVVDQLADSSIILKARAWTRTDFYWSLFYQMNERIYKELPSVGIHFPFPQLDVHLPQ